MPLPLLGSLQVEVVRPVQIDVAREKVAGLRNLGDETATLRLHLTAKVNETEALLAELKDFITRARSGVRSFFGPDSTQYEQVGGTRKSERGKKKANKGGKAGTDNKN